MIGWAFPVEDLAAPITAVAFAAVLAVFRPASRRSYGALGGGGLELALRVCVAFA